MAWITPKTNWISTDRFNIADYNRIKNNLEYLHEYAQRFYDNGPFIQFGELNRIESAVLKIYELLGRQEAGLSKLSFRLGNAKGVKA